jgi:drug/metabolite transporter (DMT)-like permease
MGLEKMSLLKGLGLLAGISGAVLLTLQKESSGNSSNVLLGDVLVMINAISYAFYMVMVKPLMVEYGPLNVIRWVFTIGFLFTLPFGWSQFNAIEWSTFSMQAYAATAGIVIGATFLAYLFNLYGIHKLGASVTGSYIYTQPVFAALVAIYFMGESYTWIKGVSALLIIAGVLLVSGKNLFRKKTVG